MKRYHPFLVTLHWILSIAITAWLLMGSNTLSEMSNADPEKIGSLKIHMGVGIGILVLMITRLAVRIRSSKLVQIDANTKLNKFSTIGHYALYTATILMSVSGIVAAQTIGLGDIVFFNADAQLPKDFHNILPLVAHHTLSVILIFLVIGHVFAALYHQFTLRENVFSRVWFGNRK